MSKYIKRDSLSSMIEYMLSEAKRTKSRVSVECFRPRGKQYRDNKYWNDYIDKIDDSITHYCKTANTDVYPDCWDNKFTIKKLKVIKYILSLRRNNGSNSEIL
jgi:hypothetical protein